MGKARDLARISPDGSGRILLPSGVAGVLPDANAPSGSVIQVVSSTKTNTFSTGSTSFVDVTGLSVSITPSSSSSKILVMAYVAVGKSTAAVTMLNIVRDSTAIAIGDARGVRLRTTASVYWGGSDVVSHLDTVPLVFLDSPAATSATIYKIQMRAQAGTTSYVNQDGADYDNGDYGETTVSTITVMEISA